MWSTTSRVNVCIVSALERVMTELQVLRLLQIYSWHLASCEGRDIGEDGLGEGPKGRNCSCGYSKAIAMWRESLVCDDS